VAGLPLGVECGPSGKGTWRQVLARKLLSLLVLSFLSASPAFAASQSVDLSSGSASFISTGPVLDGGDDVITFTGLPAGLYEFWFSLSAQDVTGLAASVNGQSANVTSSGVFSFASLASSDGAQFVLTLTGTAGLRALYSGEFQVTLVPEPAVLGLLLVAGALAATRSGSRSA
jgi:hypothetical protein